MREEPHIYTVTNQKGGTGKTTTAHAIGSYLAEKGYKVLFVDSDPQTALTYTCGGSTAGKGLLELYQESIAGKPDTAAAIQATASGDLIAASAGLAAAEVMLASVTAAKEYRLKDILERVKNNYDAVIIDTPPTLGALTVNALVASDTVIAPAGADIYSLLALSQLIDTINTVKRFCNPALNLKGLIITRYAERTTISRQLKAQFEQYAQENGTRLFDTVIRECTALKEAALTKQSIYQYAPKSNAAADYTALCAEIFN